MLWKVVSWRILLRYSGNGSIQFTLDLGHLVTLFLKAVAWSDEVYYKQIHPILIIITCLPSNLSNPHHFIHVKVIFKIFDEVGMFSKGLAEKESDLFGLLSDWVKFKFDGLSELLDLSPHVLQFDHFIHLLLRKAHIIIGFRHI